MQEDFKRLNQNYQDYLRDFYSGKSEQLMKSVEFIVHKDKFIKYLNEFVQELQRHSRRIEQILRKNLPLMENEILEKVIESELDIPHALAGNSRKCRAEYPGKRSGKMEFSEKLVYRFFETGMRM